MGELTSAKRLPEPTPVPPAAAPLRSAPEHRASSSLLGPVVSSVRALSGRLKCTARRRKFNKDSLPVVEPRVSETLISKPEFPTLKPQTRNPHFRNTKSSAAPPPRSAPILLVR